MRSSTYHLNLLDVVNFHHLKELMGSNDNIVHIKGVVIHKDLSFKSQLLENFYMLKLNIWDINKSKNSKLNCWIKPFVMPFRRSTFLNILETRICYGHNLANQF